MLPHLTVTLRAGLCFQWSSSSADERVLFATPWRLLLSLPATQEMPEYREVQCAFPATGKGCVHYITTGKRRP